MSKATDGIEENILAYYNSQVDSWPSKSLEVARDDIQAHYIALAPDERALPTNASKAQIACIMGYNQAIQDYKDNMERKV